LLDFTGWLVINGTLLFEVIGIFAFALSGLGALNSSLTNGIAASTGTVMIAVVPLILGFQLLLAFVSHDVSAVPTRPKHRQDFAW